MTEELASNFQSAMTRAGLELEIECAPLPPAVENAVLNLAMLGSVRQKLFSS